MLAAVYIAGTLVFFILAYLWLDETLSRASHGVRDHKGELIERRLRNRRSRASPEKLGSPPPLPERRRPNAYGRRTDVAS